MKKKILKIKQVAVVTALSLCFFQNGYGMSAKDIMLKVEAVERNAFDSSIQKIKLATCKYGTKGKRRVCVEKPRVKVIESVQKDTGVNKRDSQSISIILKPIGEKGVGMLTYDYDHPDKDADNWLYLSALKKVKRMISSTEDDESESGSFFGTEFSIEDMESNKVEEYTYKILEETTYQKRAVWVIESTPTAKKARKSKYSKSILWVDKERFLILKGKMINRRGILYKQITMRKVQKVDGVWIARRVSMNNLISKRITQMKLIDIAFNITVPDRFLTQKTLTDFSYRERELARLRKHLK